MTRRQAQTAGGQSPAAALRLPTPQPCAYQLLLSDPWCQRRISACPQEDGRSYYYIELNSIEGTEPPHTVSAFTTKGELAYLFITSATNKQWANSAGLLRKVAYSFRA